MRVAWLMLDGVGLMPQHGLHPFQGGHHPTLEHLGIAAPLDQTGPDFVTRAIDARLGVAGLPQSGTGQTTILTGVNAAAAMGYHYGPWVSPSLKKLLADNLLVRVAARGGTVRLGNYYPERYLEALREGKLRPNAIATAALAAGARLEGAEGLGIAPPLRPLEAEADQRQIESWARRFVRSEADLTIFDEWWTDQVGHEMDLGEARRFAARLEIFCRAALEYRPEEVLLLVTSDHGNFEDLSVKTHTLNPVPLAAIGPGATDFAEVHDLTGIAPALARVLRE